VGIGFITLTVLTRSGNPASLFPSNYLPHRYCYLGQSGLVWTNVAADGFIAASYLLIFACLFWVMGKVRHLPELREFQWIFIGFGAFILACGATHMTDVATVWWPVYPLSAAIKPVCAAVAIPTAIYFARVAPQLAANIRGFVELASRVQREKDQVLLTLAAARQQADAARIAAALALAETNNRFRLLVEGVKAHALFTVDTTGCVTSWNRGAERLLGYSESEIVGRNFACMFTSEDIRLGVPVIQMEKAREAGQAEDEGWRVRADGELFWADVNKTALQDDGSIRGFAVVVQDVTERKKIATAMEEARLEKLRLQEGFLSHVSHELRTPLTAIYFFTTNVLDGLFGDLTQEQREHLSLSLDNANQLKNMVSDLLDITRIETRKLTVASQPTNVVKLILEVLSTCGTNAVGRNISLGSEFAEGLPSVWADPSRVRQILTNLVDNGIKFTPDGGTVTVRGQSYAEHDCYLCLSVSDTGCGISPENRDVIFERLAQVKSNTEASRSGLGLGLFIARELVSLHGGRIWVESTLGEGSTFYLTLPIFSLSRWCARVLVAPNLETGCVTLIAVDIIINGALNSDFIHEIKRALERCIQPGQDVILPSRTNPDSNGTQRETIFIVACTGPAGFAVIENRIKRELHNAVNISRFRPIISSTTVPVTPSLSHEQQLAEITAGIERLVQEHLAGKEKVE
jgi:PAS domain S-box-containing protein